MSPEVTPTGAVVYGYNKGAIALFAYVLPNSRVYVAAELKAKRKPIELFAKDILAKFDELGWQNVTLACPNSMAPDDDEESEGAEAPTQTFATHRVNLSPVEIGDKEHGWTRTHEYFRFAPDGRPWLIVSPRCKQLIRTMPALVGDPSNEDDLDNGQEDRAALALRTLLASRPAPGSVRQSATPPSAWSLGWFKALDTKRSPGLLARR